MNESLLEVRRDGMASMQLYIRQNPAEILLVFTRITSGYVNVQQACAYGEPKPQQIYQAARNNSTNENISIAD